MSTIGSEYSSHRRSVDELEQDYELQRKKAAEREKTREAKLERNLSDTVKKKDKEAENSVQNVKDRYESTLADQAKTDKFERDSLKRAVYDRTGRSMKSLTDEAKQERDRAIEHSAGTEAAHKNALSKSEEYHERQSREAAAEKEKDMEALAESYRKQIAEARGKDDEAEDLDTYRAKLKSESQTAIREARDELMAERRRSSQMATQNEKVLKDQSKKANQHLNSRLHEKDLAASKELVSNADAERTSRVDELRPLREQIIETVEMKRKAQSQWNDSRASAIRELESDWNSKFSNQTLATDLEKQKLRQSNSETERNFGTKLGSALKERDANAAKMIYTQNKEHRDQIENSENAYEHSLSQVKLQSNHDKELSDTRLHQEQAKSQERQTRVLEKQAAAYQSTLVNQNKNQQAKIENLERVLNNKNSTSNPGEISAGAEQSVREAVTRHYDKVFKAEADRNARNQESLHTNYQAKLSDTIEDKRENSAALHRQNLTEQAAMRDTFVQHVADVEDNKRQMIDLANASNQKISDTSLRGTERSQNELRRHYEDLFAARDLEHSTRLQEVKSESEFEKRTMRREYQSQTTDIIRGYEKKLTDQKIAAEDQLRDTKAKSAGEMREKDRILKQALADQARSYDHRMAEIEAQSKDHERMLARNHEEELDKVNKANALLLSKKG